MPIDAISSYTQTMNTTESKSKNNGLTMDDFFKLMVAQLANQDMFNPVDDTQFIAQMAQFSMVQALSELSQASATAYSVSLIGKEATVAQMGSDGTMMVHKGIVDSVILYNGSPQITIDGQRFALSSVMEVREPNIIIPHNDLPGAEELPAEGEEVSGGEELPEESVEPVEAEEAAETEGEENHG
ncbi:MAG: flagellar hook assembly protein FlgD [Anaerovoracaceae bacterium]|jgi:flagellar basal-body rod modification protein FlgD